MRVNHPKVQSDNFTYQCKLKSLFVADGIESGGIDAGFDPASIRPDFMS